MPVPHGHLVVFVATRPTDVPPGCAKFLSVDGSVPGYTLRWDHHVSGEPINLDAMPDRFDASGFDGVGTTAADADALASALAVLFGGKACIPPEPRALLESASFWCDHLCGHPGHTEQVNRRGRGLLDAIDSRLQPVRRAASSAAFSAVTRELANLVANGQPLPFVDSWRLHERRVQRVAELGKIRCCGAIALVDLRDAPDIDPAAVYAQHRCPLSVHIRAHEDGGHRYTVGTHPHLESAPTDIRAALVALAAAEFEHGPPALSASSEPGQENWGGRARVFGSPFNYGSRLAPTQVAEIISRALRLPLGGQH